MTSRIRAGVDAGNLVRDRRGMGRLARSVLKQAENDPRFEVTLLAATRRDRDALRSEFTSFGVAETGTAKKAGRFDVLWYPFNGVRFRSAAPSLVLIHDVFAFTEAHPERIARHREQSPIARAAREATAFVTTTQWNRLEIARELGIPREKIAVIAPCPDAFFVPAAPLAAPVATHEPAMAGSNSLVPAEIASRPFVLVVGGGEARKNLAMFVEACARALSGRDELLIVVGSLPDAERERIAASGVRAFQVDAGDAMLRDLYRSAALVAVPSRAEGFGLVAVEAMACGAAVLAGDGSGLREATKGAATLIPPEGTVLWAATIRALLDDPVRRADLAERGRAAFANSDRTAHARGMLAALARLAEART